MITLLIIIIFCMAGILFRLDDIIQELKKLNGSEKRKTFRERLKEVAEERKLKSK